MSAQTPCFSIVIPVKPGGIVTALTALRQLDFPPAQYEVIVAEGTRPSVQRNCAVRSAHGKMVFFLDDDSMVRPDALLRLAAIMTQSEVSVIGGPSLTPTTDTPFQRAVGYALQTRIGSGGVRNRYRQVGVRRDTNDRELILCNLCIHRELFLAEGGLDERLYPNEENELLDRLHANGHRLLHDPQLAIWRSQRSTVRAFLRQMYGYGRGRGEQTRIASRCQLGTFIPPMFVCYVLSLLIFHHWWYLLPLAAYSLLVLLTALQAQHARTIPGVGWRLCLIIPAIHIFYGVGIVVGLLWPRFDDPAKEDCPVTIRQIKEFGQPWGHG